MAKQVRPVRYDNGLSRELQPGETLLPEYLGTGTRTGTKFLNSQGEWIDLADILQDYAEAMNYDITHAINVIAEQYGVTVSVDAKNKDLNKFGFTTQCQTTSTELQRLPSGVYNEADISRNLVTTISSDNALDKMQVTIEGHKVGSDISVSSITQTTGTATLTTGTAHGFIVGEWVNIEGADQTGYNGKVQVVSTPTTTSITYLVDSATVSPATGTITVNSMNRTFVTQTITLNGQTQVSLTTPLCNATRLEVPPQNRATPIAGTIYVYKTDTDTAGVPTNATSSPSTVHLMNGINGAINNSLKAKTALSSTDFWIVTGFHGHFEEKASGFATVTLQKRELGGIWEEIEDVSVSSGQNTASINFKPYKIIPYNSEVRLLGTCDVNNKEVGGSIQGYLAKVV